MGNDRNRIPLFRSKKRRNRETEPRGIQYLKNALAYQVLPDGGDDVLREGNGSRIIRGRLLSRWSVFHYTGLLVEQS
jgi:hypothetical protein